MTMMPATHRFPFTLDDRLAELATTRSGLLAELENWKGRDALVKEDPGRWSVAEIVLHLHNTERSVSKGLRRIFSSGQRQARRSEEDLRAEWERLRTLVGSRGAPQSAPSFVVPVNAPGLPEGVELLKKSRAELLEMLQCYSLDDLASISMPHPFPIIGILTGAGWLSTIAFHEMRHTEQIRELRPLLAK